MNSTERLKEMLARAEAATEGPWELLYLFGSSDLPVEIRAADGTTMVLEWNEKSSSSVDDVKLMATSRTDVPMLCKLLIQAIEMAHFYSAGDVAREFLSEVERALGGKSNKESEK